MAPSTAKLTTLDHSTPALSSAVTREQNISHAVIVSYIGINSRNSSMTVKGSSTPRINTHSWAVSVTSELSLFAAENAMNNFILFWIWPSMFREISSILSAIVLLNRLMLARSDWFSGHTTSSAIIIHIFTSSPSENGLDAFTNSSAIW